MKEKTRFFAAVIVFMLASCAVITVNIYFPEKDVKEAYKNLEKELMEGEKKKPEAKPESLMRFELIPSAYAQEAGLAEKISEIVKKMPDVVNAYKEMGARISDIDRLRDSGLVGEGSNGLLITREGKPTLADEKLVSMENENRKTVIKGMARAIIRLNRDQETDANFKKVMPQAAEQFSAVRRDNAKKGWWIQDSAGNWTRK